MKSLLAILLTTLPLFSSNVFADDDDRRKRKSSFRYHAPQVEVYDSYYNNWDRTSYRKKSRRFECYSAWGEKIHRTFNRKQKRFVELGGGSCRKIKYRVSKYENVGSLYNYGIPESEVHRMIDKIYRKYSLRNARVIQIDNLRHDGLKYFKYNITFSVGDQYYRTFKVKHDQWNGKVKKIREV